jgi:membrane protease YdiL (CAAX protease family)
LEKLEKILRWLDDEPKAWISILFYCLSFAALAFFVNIVVAIIFDLVGLQIPVNTGRGEPISMGEFFFPIKLFYLAAVEEFIFRMVPMLLAVALFPRSAKVFIFVAISSVIFGYLHGGWPNIFIQGVTGCFFSLIYLKCGGWYENHMKGFLASSFMHFCMNGLIALIALSQGVKNF